jgi:hypothetical protein
MIDSVPAPRIESRKVVSDNYLAQVDAINALDVPRKVRRKMLADAHTAYSAKWELAPLSTATPAYVHTGFECGAL